MNRWLIDFDSTLAQTFSNQVRLVNEHFGKNYTGDQFVSWGVENVLAPEEIEFLWGDQCFLNYDFQMSCPPLPHAMEALQVLIDRGDEFTIVSDRPTSLYGATLDWLWKYAPKLVDGGGPCVILTRSPHSRSNQDLTIPTKAQVAFSNRLHHVVEDSPHHSYDLAELEFTEQVYLLHYPNNAHISHNKIKRVESWEEIIA